MNENPKYKKGDKVLTGYTDEIVIVSEHEGEVLNVHQTVNGWAYDIYIGGVFPVVTYKFPEIYIKQKS